MWNLHKGYICFVCSTEEARKRWGHELYKQSFWVGSSKLLCNYRLNTSNCNIVSWKWFLTQCFKYRCAQCVYKSNKEKYNLLKQTNFRTTMNVCLVPNKPCNLLHRLAPLCFHLTAWSGLSSGLCDGLMPWKVAFQAQPTHARAKNTVVFWTFLVHLTCIMYVLVIIDF
jgi:hypothetical protein